MELLSMVELENYLMTEFKKIPEKENVKFDIQFRSPKYDCQQYITISNGKYHLMCYERGKLIQDDATSDLDQFSYLIFNQITHDAAYNYTKNRNIKYQDRRRIWFPKWIELMGYISNKFQEQCKEEIEKILQKNPYDNCISIKLDVIDDIERFLNMLKNMDPPESLIDKIDKNIESIKQLQRGEVKNFSHFISSLCSEAELISNSINDPDLDFIGNDLKRAVERIKQAI